MSFQERGFQISHLFGRGDDLSFAGYLSPSEVLELHKEIAFWIKPALGDDPIFPLFVDRVTRAVDGGFGLLTIHAGL